MINADSRNSSAKELNGQHWEIDPYRRERPRCLRRADEEC